MINKMYRYAPLFIKEMMVTVYGLYWKNRRYGGVFRKELQAAKERELFNATQWEQYQTEQLRKLLIHAYQTVPFYREKYSKAGFTLHDLKKFELNQLSLLPILEKKELRKYGTTSLLSSKRKSGIFISSSGSTGTPVKIYFSKKIHQQWSAIYEARVRNWAGVNYKQSRGMIGGRRIVPTNTTSLPLYIRNYAENQTYFSAYHISSKTYENYLEGMLKYPLDYLVGYATSIYFLASLFEEHKCKVPKLKAVLTSSEQLTPIMRSCIERVFHCKVFDAYSGAEACGLISENKFGELLFSPDAGIMEVLKSDGSTAQNGEIIATGLLNFDQPLIRYKIGDNVKIATLQTSLSGLQFSMIEEIEGRTEDVVIGADGQKMVRFHGLFINIPHLVMAQLVQNSLTTFTINLKVESAFSLVQEQIIQKRLESQVGKVKIQFNYIAEIPRESNGKFKAVISLIKHHG